MTKPFTLPPEIVEMLEGFKADRARLDWMIQYQAKVTRATNGDYLCEYEDEHTHWTTSGKTARAAIDLMMRDTKWWVPCLR